MPIPTVLTEDALAAFQVTTLSSVAGVLGWTVTTDEVAEAVIGTLVAYYGSSGVDNTIANATDIAKLRALARREIWRAAVPALITYYTFATDGQTFNRSDMVKFAESQLAKAEAAAEPYDTAAIAAAAASAPVVYASTIRYPADPYIYLADEDRIP
jgi:hypothetical protein